MINKYKYINKERSKNLGGSYKKKEQGRISFSNSPPKKVKIT